MKQEDYTKLEEYKDRAVFRGINWDNLDYNKKELVCHLIESYEKDFNKFKIANDKIAKRLLKAGAELEKIQKRYLTLN